MHVHSGETKHFSTTKPVEIAEWCKFSKGNKIISIPSAKVQAREEFVKVLACVPDGASVTLHAGKRKLTLKPSDLEHYYGERGRRGNKLPRGLQRVDEYEIEFTKAEPIEEALPESSK